MWGDILPCRFQLFGVLQFCLRERSSESIWQGDNDAKYIETIFSTENGEAKLLPMYYK
jgi:hypothetical protein